MSSVLTQWMSWFDGVDLVAATQSNLPMPNVIVHVARLVHTPVGSAPAGLVFYQPDPAAPPAVMGFVSPDENVGRYFGPKIFAGTPFESAPVLKAGIEIGFAPDWVGAVVTIGALTIRTKLGGLQALEQVQRAPAPMTPFWQQGGEAAARSAQLWVNDREVSILVPPIGISGGPAAVSAPFGSYAR